MSWKFFRKIRVERAILYGVIFLSGILFVTGFEAAPGHRGLKSLLKEKLVLTRPAPPSYYNPPENSKNAIYVLGGSQESLQYRFKEASILYHRGLSRKIFILREDGKTEFDPVLRRNLVKNEWALKKLTELGVKKEDIEPLRIKEGVFGTLSEAREVPGMISGMGYKRLALVSSSYHTARVLASYSRSTEGDGLELYVYGSGGEPRLKNLLLEYFKFILYTKILLK